MIDLDALQAAALLQAAYIRRGDTNNVVTVERNWVVIENPGNRVMIAPDFALFTARMLWEEVGQ